MAFDNFLTASVLGGSPDITGNQLSQTLYDATIDPNKIVVPIPVPTQAQSTSKKKVQPQQNLLVAPEPPKVDFGVAPTYNTAPVPDVGVQPVWHEALGQYLNGRTLAQVVAPPTYQGFGLPVLDSATSFALTPDQYNRVLDTTKQDIAFNNKVTGDNYSNLMNVVKMLDEQDKSNQEQYSRTLQNRNSILSGNNLSQEMAYRLSPQDQAALDLKKSLALTDYSTRLTGAVHDQLAQEESRRRLALEKEMAKVHYGYQLALQRAKTKSDEQQLSKAFRLESMKKVVDIYGDTWKKAVEGLQPGDLDRYRAVAKTGDAGLMASFLEELKNTSPVSAYNMKAAFQAQQLLNNVTGGAMGNIFSAEIPTKQPAQKVFSSKDEILNYKGD